MNTKKRIIAMALLFSASIYSQVGIGTSNPSAKSILDLSATDKGFLLPRMTTVQRVAMAPNNTTDRGMQVYDIDTLSIWYWNGSSWIQQGSKNIYDTNGDISPTASTNREVNFSNGGVLNFDQNTLAIDATNNKVGIGTGAPTFPLEVMGSNTLDGIAIGNTSLGSGFRTKISSQGSGTNDRWMKFNSDWNTTTFNSRAFGFFRGNNEYLTILDNGNLGIGTNSPIGRLEVTQPPGTTSNLVNFMINNCGAPCGQGTARNLILSNANGTNSTFASLDFVPSIVPSDPTGASIVGIDRDRINHYAGIQFLTRNASDYAARMTLKSSGNVGIGTVNPTAKLEVNEDNTIPFQSTVSISSNPQALGTQGFNGPNPNLTKASSGIQFKGWAGLNEGGIFRQTGSANKSHMLFTVNNTNDVAMVINENRRIGIGTTSPGAGLHVNLAATDPNNGVLSLQKGSIQYDFYLVNNFNSTNYDSGAANYSGNGVTNAMVLNLAGEGQFIFGDNIGPWSSGGYDIGKSYAAWRNIYLTNSPIVSSDRRLKSDIEPLKLGLKEVMQMNPKIYKKFIDFEKTSGGELEYGFIAQELKEILPLAVNGSPDDINPMGVKYEQIIPILTQATKDLKNQLDTQQAIIEELKKEIELLKSTRN